VVLRVTHVAAQRSQVEVLKQLLSPTDDMNEHVDVTCEALMCMEEQHANQIVAFASREQRGVWALIRWAQQHMATGTGRSSQATLLSHLDVLIASQTWQCSGQLNISEVGGKSGLYMS
jgi:hypothetical protein